ncbi:hypothetical protein CNY89_11155 [Amaricoccus sp. HAR-UPW-R2A-40]|nr:hypothetical protein CNY89_11155 [Amaricoccus sp. HAR-UPW-R2A-40]
MENRFQRDLVELVPRLRRFAYALCGTTDMADDLVQAACERALRNASGFQPGTRMDSWMFRIIQNLWLDDRRRRKVRGHQIDPDMTALWTVAVRVGWTPQPPEKSGSFPRSSQIVTARRFLGRATSGSSWDELRVAFTT